MYQSCSAGAYDWLDLPHCMTYIPIFDYFFFATFVTVSASYCECRHVDLEDFFRVTLASETLMAPRSPACLSKTSFS